MTSTRVRLHCEAELSRLFISPASCRFGSRHEGAPPPEGSGAHAAPPPPERRSSYTVANDHRPPEQPGNRYGAPPEQQALGNRYNGPPDQPQQPPSNQYGGTGPHEPPSNRYGPRGPQPGHPGYDGPHSGYGPGFGAAPPASAYGGPPSNSSYVPRAYAPPPMNNSQPGYGGSAYPPPAANQPNYHQATPPSSQNPYAQQDYPKSQYGGKPSYTGDYGPRQPQPHQQPPGAPPGGPSFDPHGAKKSVSFHSDLATEIEDRRRFESTSSAGSVQPPTPSGGAPPMPPGGAPLHYAPPERVEEAPPPLPNSAPPMEDRQAPPRQGSRSPATRPPDSYHTPEHTQPPPDTTFVAGNTPGVVGAQEIYNDPRGRILASRKSANLQRPTQRAGAVPERMSFRDKMKMFAAEIGENTPQEKSKSSRVQRELEHDDYSR